MPAAAFGQGPNSLPTPLPQPFSPNGVLRPIIPFTPAVPIPSTRPLSVVPLPTPAPNIRIAPLHTPANVVASQAQGLIKQVPVHRRWPVLQPRDDARTPAASAGTAGRAPAGGSTARYSGAAMQLPGVPDHRRPLGW
jgi:hypothetical protein